MIANIIPPVISFIANMIIEMAIPVAERKINILLAYENKKTTTFEKIVSITESSVARIFRMNRKNQLPSLIVKALLYPVYNCNKAKFLLPLQDGQTLDYSFLSF